MKTKEQKRQEAIERVEIYNNLTPSKKLELIKSRRGKSKKEQKKLITKMEGN